MPDLGADSESTCPTNKSQFSLYSWLDDVQLTEALGIFWRTVIVAIRAFDQLQFADAADQSFAETAARRLCTLVRHVKTLTPNGLLIAAFKLRVSRLARPHDLRPLD